MLKQTLRLVLAASILCVTVLAECGIQTVWCASCDLWMSTCSTQPQMFQFNVTSIDWSSIWCTYGGANCGSPSGSESCLLSTMNIAGYCDGYYLTYQDYKCCRTML
jgi:hypothetical protein